MPKYFFIFSDGSPELETSELTDSQDAAGFAQVVAHEIGRETGKPGPAVTVHHRNDGPIKATARPLTCARCSNEQRLAGVERHEGGLRLTFVCMDCQLNEVRCVTPVQHH